MGAGLPSAGLLRGSRFLSLHAGFSNLTQVLSASLSSGIRVGCVWWGGVTRELPPISPRGGSGPVSSRWRLGPSHPGARRGSGKRVEFSPGSFSRELSEAQGLGSFLHRSRFAPCSWGSWEAVRSQRSLRLERRGQRTAFSRSPAPGRDGAGGSRALTRRCLPSEGGGRPRDLQLPGQSPRAPEEAPQGAHGLHRPSAGTAGAQLRAAEVPERAGPHGARRLAQPHRHPGQDLVPEPQVRRGSCAPVKAHKKGPRDSFHSVKVSKLGRAHSHCDGPRRSVDSGCSAQSSGAGELPPAPAGLPSSPCGSLSCGGVWVSSVAGASSHGPQVPVVVVPSQWPRGSASFR